MINYTFILQLLNAKMLSESSLIKDYKYETLSGITIRE